MQKKEKSSIGVPVKGKNQGDCGATPREVETFIESPREKRGNEKKGGGTRKSPHFWGTSSQGGKKTEEKEKPNSWGEWPSKT